MKDKKRSLVVSAFAWIFIAGAVLSLSSLVVSITNPGQWKAVVARPFWFIQVSLSLGLAIAGLAGGIKALRLIPYSRIILLWVAAINILEIILFMPLVYFKAPLITAGKSGPAPAQYLASYIVAVTPILIFFGVFIYCFNLPGIKGQFKNNENHKRHS